MMCEVFNSDFSLPWLMAEGDVVKMKYGVWCVVVWCAVCAAVARGGQELTVADGEALLRVARAAAGGKDFSGGAPAGIKAADERVVILTFYRVVSGPTAPGFYWAFSHAAAGATLRAGAEVCGAQLRGWLKNLPGGAEELEQGRLAVDVVTEESVLSDKHRILALKEIEVGVHGLVCRDKEEVFYLTPTDVFSYAVEAKEGDLLAVVWLKRMSRTVPRGLHLARIRTAAFVEEQPGGEGVAVEWGNVLHGSPDPDAMLRACFQGALWLLRTQQEDGSFLPAYNPAQEKRVSDEACNLIDHLYATLVITQLNFLIPDERFVTARDRALAFAGRFLFAERRLQMLYLRTKRQAMKNLSLRRPGRTQMVEGWHDEVEATALLLAVLCLAESGKTEPETDRMMRQLGTYLSALSDENGWLHISLADAQVDSPQRIVKGEVYAEVLLALCMLQRISPAERVGKAMGRMTGLMAGFGADSPPVGPRTIEALAAAYKVAGDERIGKLVLRLGERLTQARWQAEGAKWRSYVGGFKERDAAPRTFVTAQAVSGLVASYGMARILREPHKAYRDAVHEGAMFLINMQFCPENVFYLRHHRVILGGFRKGVDDLTLEPGEAAEAMRALVGAAMMIGELTPPG